MKQYTSIPLLTLLGAVAAFVLRFQFCRTGFEAATGLPVPGNLYARLFLVLLAVLAVLCLLLVSRVPDEKRSPSQPFAEAFSTRQPLLLMVLIAGMFLLGISGALEILSAFRPDVPHMGLFSGLLTLIAACCLLPLLPLCRRRPKRMEGEAPASGISHILLVPVCCLVVRLVLIYRVDSVNPSISAYFVEILALVFLTLSFYRLSSFAYQVGRTRRFLLYALPAVILSIATLAEGHPLYGTLFYVGAAVTLMGFLLLRLDALSVSAHRHS